MELWVHVSDRNRVIIDYKKILMNFIIYIVGTVETFIDNFVYLLVSPYSRNNV